MSTENRWVEDHGPDEIYRKFDVFRVSTGERLPDDEFVFVMRPERDEAAFHAMVMYAREVAYRAPRLAGQILDRLEAIRDLNEGRAA